MFNIAIALIVILIAAAYYVWAEYIRRVPLKEFGIENVQTILMLEPEHFRDKVWARGWMTSYEWTQILERQEAAVSAELRRRGIKSVNDMGRNCAGNVKQEN